MANPGTQMAAGAGGRGRLRASHADREQAIDLLKTAFVQGRLAKDEFDARIDQALASRTYAELSAVTTDIPPAPTVAPTRAVPTAAAPPRKAAGILARPSMNKAVTSGACVIVVGHVGMLGALLTGNGVLVLLMGLLIVVGAAVAIVAMIIAS
jgi:Domain of unknown function (DUF1707)